MIYLIMNRKYRLKLELIVIINKNKVIKDELNKIIRYIQADLVSYQDNNMIVNIVFKQKQY